MKKAKKGARKKPQPAVEQKPSVPPPQSSPKPFALAAAALRERT